MPRPPFDATWTRIRALEGAGFATKTGLPFHYAINGEQLTPSRTGYPLHKREFQSAYPHVPCAGPGAFVNEVRGPSYVWAILHDPRIRKDEW